MDKTDKDTCLTCKSLRGEISLTPGEVIHSGKFWQVEHAYPTSLSGWLVCVLKRHTKALHELTEEELIECAKLQHIFGKALQKTLGCEKEYVACFGEGAGFNHVHFHIIARPKDLPEEARGPKVFSLLGKKVTNPISEQEVRDVCGKLKKEIKNFFVDIGM